MLYELLRNLLGSLLLYRISYGIGIDKKLLVGAAHGFNSQFLNLFAFSISVSFL